MSTGKAFIWGSLAAASLLLVLLLQNLAGPQSDGPTNDQGIVPLNPEESVRTLKVEISLGASGESLKEPVALDLGLGFPLWLAPVGQSQGLLRPFGAMPQIAAGNSISRGETATFEFSADTDPGLDAFLTSSQLLSDVKVADISRIGFASRGESGWVLARYKITINGKPFASHEQINSNALEQLTAASQRLHEIAEEIASQQSELIDLDALATAGLATQADQQRLEELQIALAPKLNEQRQLDRQLLGEFPWYMDGDFHPSRPSLSA